MLKRASFLVNNNLMVAFQWEQSFLLGGVYMQHKPGILESSFSLQHGSHRKTGAKKGFLWQKQKASDLNSI